MEQLTLCAPDRNKSCFACCPPIRPRDYEHLQYRNIVKRILRENTRSFYRNPRKVIPITGFSCWALGYLDNQFKRIGCLLHPCQNNGKDLRYLVDYGEKCLRENCQEALTFARLSSRCQRYLLQLTENMDSFEYSSRKHNPLFRLLGWGINVIEEVVDSSIEQGITPKNLLEIYPVLQDTPEPRSCTYLLESVMRRLQADVLQGPEFARRFGDFSNRLLREISPPWHQHTAPFAHRLGIGKSFEDMLRLGLNIKRIEKEAALSLKEEIDHRIDDFASEMMKASP
ncbi:MAG: hypothetical protein DRH12_07295 [Deltaproteobacteria bacterium]|nr:MAG: hypothetical protein DRH12_07295 [Deltaproteobacteria bacterium]